VAYRRAKRVSEGVDTRLMVPFIEGAKGRWSGRVGLVRTIGTRAVGHGRNRGNQPTRSPLQVWRERIGQGAVG
jgi:hypothetical protein